MGEPALKRARLSIAEVMLELDNDNRDEHMMLNSDDEFEDIIHDEKERDESGAVDNSEDIEADLSLQNQSIFLPPQPLAMHHPNQLKQLMMA